MPAHTVRPRIRPGLAAAGALVLLVHALLLNGWTPGPGQQPRGDGDRPPASGRLVQTVRLAAAASARVPAPVALPVPMPMPMPVSVRLPEQASQPGRPVAVARPGAAERATPLSTAIATNTAPVASNADVNAADAAEAAASPLDAAQPAGLPVPTYATQLPPSTTLQFTMRRGTATGRAELTWQTDAGRYQLQMRGQLATAPQLAWRSKGRLDAHGIAPDRYGEWRRGRELRAANFQRGSAGGLDADRITFSGPQAQYPLLAGAQDRISWMLQLPAVLAANPQLQAPGSAVQLFVAGARGDAEVWTFVVQGTGAVTLADGSSIGNALHLQREAGRPYDTRADIWLDPLRGHLPVRALLTVRPGGDATEFVLERQPPP